MLAREKKQFLLSDICEWKCIKFSFLRAKMIKRFIPL